MNEIEILKEKNEHKIGDLVDIMRILRSEGGCPWDREQTHETIRKNLIEETYEVVEAIDTKNTALLREELGDLLLQVVFHARIAQENGEFDFDDVCNDICKKLIIRHPHIFSDVEADTSEKVLENWDKIKMREKSQKTPVESMDSVARTLPALMRAEKLASKAAKSGLDKRTLEEKVGELLLLTASICKECDIDGEKALYDACEKMIEDKKREENSK
ncbi:MAG: nucleoside triphosphate pyrophosphohydrolase [Ruminococcaceae bacterium]|nr:nucleoside triphosphate pyrophosphohydrolase [Oscillospiraceae bacterium]